MRCQAERDSGDLLIVGCKNWNPHHPLRQMKSLPAARRQWALPNLAHTRHTSRATNRCYKRVYRDEPGATNASFRMRFLRPILANPQGTESVC